MLLYNDSAESYVLLDDTMIEFKNEMPVDTNELQYIITYVKTKMNTILLYEICFTYDYDLLWNNKPIMTQPIKQQAEIN